MKEYFWELKVFAADGDGYFLCLYELKFCFSWGVEMTSQTTALTHVASR
jgi:hypothetical protein